MRNRSPAERMSLKGHHPASETSLDSRLRGNDGGYAMVSESGNPSPFPLTPNTQPPSALPAPSAVNPPIPSPLCDLRDLCGESPPAHAHPHHPAQHPQPRHMPRHRTALPHVLYDHPAPTPTPTLPVHPPSIDHPFASVNPDATRRRPRHIPSPVVGESLPRTPHTGARACPCVGRG